MATLKFIDKYQQKDKITREKQKEITLNKREESSEEKRPRDKFARNITKEDIGVSPVFKGVFGLKELLKTDSLDPSMKVEFGKQLEERKQLIE